MGKLIDITDKLTFEGNPRVKIKNTELEVNADASTMIRVLALMKDGKQTSVGNVLEAVGLLFSEPEKKKLEAMHLSFRDYLAVVTASMELAMGTEDEPGEEGTRTTT